VGETEASRHAAVPELAEGETTLDEIGLRIGESWQLQPVSDFDQTRYYVTLIGYLRGVSVIVTTPNMDGKAMLIREGQPYIVRAFSGKSAYAFKTTVLRATGFPVPYLHLDYPERVSGIVVRSAERVDVNIVASISVKSSDGDKSAALIRNISKAGVSLETRSAIGGTGTGIVMAFKLEVDGHEHILSVSGVIRAQRPAVRQGASMIEYGVQIVDLDPVDRLVLTAFVSNHLAQA
jgi:c-di-GMP-binding flagellar brake protein YcgR